MQRDVIGLNRLQRVHGHHIGERLKEDLDPREPDIAEGQADVADKVQERVHAEMDQTVRAPMVVGDPERDRRADQRPKLGRRALRHLERDVDVGPERAVVAVKKLLASS